MKTSKWLCAVLVAVLAIGGPLAPLMAMGQMQAPRHLRARRQSPLGLTSPPRATRSAQAS